MRWVLTDDRGDVAPVAARLELRARAGIALLGSQVVVHGLDLHYDCEDLGFVHYLLFCVTGRRADPRHARVLERLWVSTGYPDARIWCNRIAGYMGSARVDPGLAMSAAVAASNSVTYGFIALREAYRAQQAMPEPLPERERWFRQKMREGALIHGYGRPIHGHDERIAAALQSLLDAGLRAGPHLQRAFWLHRVLFDEKAIEMNISAVWAALALDFGIAASEYEQFMLLMFAPGYAAVYADQRGRPPLSFLAGHQTHPQASLATATRPLDGREVTPAAVERCCPVPPSRSAASDPDRRVSAAARSPCAE